MTISIANPVQTSYIFILVFIIALLISAKKFREKSIFPPSLTEELKGLAILAIIFSHIGYFLVDDHRFLFPLSVAAGVGVNLFLFLSGLGLTASALNEKATILRFYWRRLLKLFVPFWLVLIIFFLLDYLILNLTYPSSYIFKSAAGIFTSADLFSDFNSPLWYFTLILFYYLIFPLLFFKKLPWLSAGLIYIISYLILQRNVAWLQDLMALYQVHIVAFPLGIFIGWLIYARNIFTPILPVNILNSLREIKRPVWLINILEKLYQPSILKRLRKKLGILIYYFLIVLSVLAIAYLAYHSGVGEKPDKEQIISVITVLLIIFLFQYKKIEFRLLNLFGVYSYEIYLLHWPILSRYELFYGYLPGWLATILYLILFLALGFLLKKISKFILKIFFTAGINN
jgi:peptidoglycan/LPS O-acetylase OafA/YrhL